MRSEAEEHFNSIRQSKLRDLVSISNSHTSKHAVEANQCTCTSSKILADESREEYQNSDKASRPTIKTTPPDPSPRSASAQRKLSPPPSV